jgi:gluconate 2-dehydrogenase gamma chain
LDESKRNWLRGALVSGASAGATLGGVLGAQADTAVPTAEAAKPSVQGYLYLTPDEAGFVEALVNHMVPADHLTPNGVDLGIAVYIDRALAGGWGRGDRMYLQGPWPQGLPAQGYQSPLTPAEIYRTGIAQTNAHCQRQYGQTFDLLSEAEKETVLKALEAGQITFSGGLAAKNFFGIAYQTVVEGLFADPIYGGNRDKQGWKMIGFPGVIETHALNIVSHKNKPFRAPTLGIEDLS